MKESAHAAILDRETPAAQVKEQLTPQLDLLADLAAYGSNLVVRAYNSSPQQMAELIVCGVLLKQVVAMIDATHVLLSAGCGHAAHLPMRTAWEASLYLDWILSGNSERRATCYFVGNYRDERRWADRVTPGTLEEAAFSPIAKAIGLDFQTERPTLAADATSRRAEVDRILAQPELQAIDAEFQQLRGNKRKRDPEWYELDGMKSIRDIAKSLDRLAEYEAFYSKGSQVTHTGTYKDHLHFAEGNVHFKPIRHLADANQLLTVIVVIAMKTYERVLTCYRPGEVPALMKKYRDDWRQPHLHATSLNVKFEAA